MLIQATSPKVKPHKRYIFYRIYMKTFFIFLSLFGCAWIIMWTIQWSQRNHSSSQPMDFMMIGGFIILILGFVYYGLRINTMIFTPNYSVLGPYQRTPLPKEKPLIKIRHPLYGPISWNGFSPNWSFSYVDWMVYHNGLGIHILGVGEAFIPKENILELRLNQEASSSPYQMPFELIHSSPEVISPLGLPKKKEFFETLRGMLISR
jgi:hypothetical protein